MDISTIEKRFLRRLAGIYGHIVILLDPEPENASERKQQKIRQWMKKKYKKTVQGLPNDLRAQFADSVSNHDLFQFLRQCRDRLAELLDQERQCFNLTAEALSVDTRAALWKLMRGENWPAVTRHGNDLEIIVDSKESYRRRLFLRDVRGIADGEEESAFGAIELALSMEDDRYCLSGDVFDAMADGYQTYHFTFATADVVTEIYNAINSICLWDHPWNFLVTAASSIVAKAYLPGSHCNEQELAMLPLLTEIAALDNWDELPEDLPFTFPMITDLAAKHGCSTLMPLFNALGKQAPDSNEYTALVEKIIAKLCEKSVEPLWREVFDQICASQAEYPDKADECCPSTVLSSTRNAIQNKMAQLGFAGTYPNFEKQGALQGIHIEESYDTPYVVGPKSKILSRIHCIETVVDRELTVQFLCGTVLLEEGDTAPDIYSCLFNSSGHCLFHHTEYSEPLYEPDFEYVPKDLSVCVSVAAKKSQLQRLTKEEQHSYSGMRDASLRTFLTFLVVVGGIFGLVMTAISLLIAMLVVVIAGGKDAIPAVLANFPWLPILLFCWLGYGGTMGLITALSKRK